MYVAAFLLLSTLVAQQKQVALEREDVLAGIDRRPGLVNVAVSILSKLYNQLSELLKAVM